MWVAREENGLLRLYTKLPYRYDLGVWRIPDDGDCVTISDEDYPQFKDLKWEDEPIKVDLEVVPQPIKPDEYMDEGDMIELESVGIGYRIDGGFVYH